MEYYIIVHNEKQGPFTREELKSKEITRDTLVWRVGLTDWVPLTEVEDLEELYTNIPPSAPTPKATEAGASTSLPQPPIPKTWFVESIIVTVLCCLPLGIIGMVYASKVEPLYYAGNFEAAAHRAHQAKFWTLLGLGLAAGLLLLSFLFYLFIFGVTLLGGSLMTAFFAL
ncbi:MAG: CD225/dispanin family protein [Bacteroidaceae bacterium]